MIKNSMVPICSVIQKGGRLAQKMLKVKWLIVPFVLVFLMTTVFIACGGDEEGSITEAGSTTVQPLAEKLANAYMKEHPSINITIQGGGTSVGVKSAADGTVDIGAASRELTSDEKGKVLEHILARDGLAIIVHPDNELSGLTTEQVRDIYAGGITNWNKVGGKDKSIHVVAREEGSGTRGAFEELVMGKGGPLITATAILQPSNGALRTTVAGDPDSIGFVSFGYLDSSVKPLSINGIASTAENAKNGIYPIVRPLLFLTKSEPTGIVKDFIDYCLGSAGQAIVVQEGYIAVK